MKAAGAVVIVAAALLASCDNSNGGAAEPCGPCAGSECTEDELQTCECSRCMNAECTDEMQACQADPNCTDHFKCFLFETSCYIDTDLGMCPWSVSTFQAVLTCANSHCRSPGPCSWPGPCGP